MGILERKNRHKEDTKKQIIEAALAIAYEEGWAALSMRKISNKIEYSVPVLYEYFKNKEDLLIELTKIGYNKLIGKLETSRDDSLLPNLQLQKFWMTYVAFAIEHKELYKLMFGIETNCCMYTALSPLSEKPEEIISETIKMLMPKLSSPIQISNTYNQLWSSIHGLLSLTMTGRQTNDINEKILIKDIIERIINPSR